MGTPAAVLGDRIVGTCIGHQLATPAGPPVVAPPLPFSAPALEGVARSVLITDKPALVVGSGGVNSEAPHVGLHATDPAVTPLTQRGSVLVGSSTVLIEDKPAAPAGARCQLCLTPAGTLQGSATTVLVGGGPGG